MTRHGFLLVAALAFTAPTVLAADKGEVAVQRQWAHWRGPLGTGVAPEGDPPLEWNERDGLNIRWKVSLPGKGHSAPVIWGDRIFVTTAVPYGSPLDPRYSKAPGAHDNLPVTSRQKFVALGLDRADGRILWQKTLREATPFDGHHNTASFASNSPVTDGRHVYAFFGSYGLYCLDVEGNEVWRADFGEMKPLHGHGEGSSPVIAGDALVVNWDHEGESYVVALNKLTGKQLWKTPRNEVTSWASPIVIEHSGRQQVVVSGTNRIRGYDPATGKVLWECGGLSTNVVASPVFADGMVFAGSSYDTRALLAIRLDGARGDITGTKQVVWSRNRSTPYVPSPVLYDDALYFLGHYQGVLTRVNAKTGEDKPGSFRLPGIQDVYSSPVAAKGRLYLTDRTGTTLVISHADKPKVLAENRIEDGVSASAAIADKSLFLRGEHFLYHLGEK